MNPQKPGQERGDHRLRPGTSQAGPPLDASKAGRGQEGHFKGPRAADRPCHQRADQKTRGRGGLSHSEKQTRAVGLTMEKRIKQKIKQITPCKSPKFPKP